MHRFVLASARLLAAAAALLALCDAAIAHHPIGGEAPRTWGEGFLSGVGHPLLGLDHLAFVLGLGALVALSPRWRRLPLAFAALIGPGVLLHAAAVSLGPQEVYVALSLIGLGAALASEQRLSAPGLAAAIALAGLLHGYAFGEAVAGSEVMPVLAYALGLTATVLGLAFASALALHRIARAFAARWRRLTAAALAATGLIFIAMAASAL